jgi:hypothetical protein
LLYDCDLSHGCAPPAQERGLITNYQKHSNSIDVLRRVQRSAHYGMCALVGTLMEDSMVYKTSSVAITEAWSSQ